MSSPPRPLARTTIASRPLPLSASRPVSRTSHSSEPWLTLRMKRYSACALTSTVCLKRAPTSSMLATFPLWSWDCHSRRCFPGERQIADLLSSPSMKESSAKTSLPSMAMHTPGLKKVEERESSALKRSTAASSPR